MCFIILLLKKVKDGYYPHEEYIVVTQNRESMRLQTISDETVGS